MSEIKENYYHIYVLLKDRIRFESQLINKQISFYSDENQMKLRYYLLEKDKVEIDKILIENEIIANYETNEIIDYRDNIKIQKVYIYIVIVIILLILIIDYIK
ncbi:hypothetical protein [Flavobacterium terrigena]|uniref:Uncharacterized protein n=1 Tax=Flavobacterium terrigena TaxID=402734 RepID=A0A1H6QQQ3_9FLAO|nr:hypothetical protein [Flavobacterium terrigena]SEI41565.1 hypothetical protein SAMN05660918_0441 [Flavobacterium terrigena]